MEYIDLVIYLHSISTISVISGIDDALDTPMVRIQSDTLENSVEEVYKDTKRYNSMVYPAG